MSNINTMSYETTPVKNIKAKTARKHLTKDMDAISTAAIVWYLVVRHRMILVSVWAIILTINWVFPPALDILRSLL